MTHPHAFSESLGVSLRIADLFCAERFSGPPAGRVRGEDAYHAGQALLPEGDTVYVRTEVTSSGAARETLGRLVAHVRYRDAGAWQDYADTMRRLGFDGEGTGSGAAA